jgi:hypothetical protein
MARSAIRWTANKPMPKTAHPIRQPSLTLTDIEAQIVEVEDDRDFYGSFLERGEAAGLGLRRGQRLLRQAEDCIVQLDRKRDAPLGREQHKTGQHFS